MKTITPHRAIALDCDVDVVAVDHFRPENLASGVKPTALAAVTVILDSPEADEYGSPIQADGGSVMDDKQIAEKRRAMRAFTHEALKDVPDWRDDSRYKQPELSPTEAEQLLLKLEAIKLRRLPSGHDHLI